MIELRKLANIEKEKVKKTKYYRLNIKIIKKMFSPYEIDPNSILFQVSKQKRSCTNLINLCII